MDLPIKNGDFPVRYVKLPEGIACIKMVTGGWKSRLPPIPPSRHPTSRSLPLINIRMANGPYAFARLANPRCAECDRDFMVIYQGHWEIFTGIWVEEKKTIKDPGWNFKYKTSGLGSFVKVNGKLNGKLSGDFL